MRAAALALALLCACAKDFDQLVPFPCARSDGSCPSPFVCAAGQCVTAPSTACALGAACTPSGFESSRGRCTVLDTGVVPAGGRLYDQVKPFCVPQQGAGERNTSCRFSAGPSVGIGFPDADVYCGQGLVCFNAGWNLQYPATCHAYCDAGTACAPGEQCLGAFPVTSANDLSGAGVCISPCTLLGSDCASGTCAVGVDARGAGSYFGYCTQPGALAEGAPCDPALNRWREQCAAGLTCWQTTAQAVCSRLCHTASDCPSSQKCCGPDACAAPATFPAGTGVCGT